MTNLDRDPYGNPIPGLDRIGRSASTFVPGRPATDTDEPITGTVVSLGEGIQADEGLLRQCFASGIIPGATVTVTASGHSTELVGPTGTVTLDAHLAAQFFVTP